MKKADIKARIAYSKAKVKRWLEENEQNIIVIGTVVTTVVIPVAAYVVKTATKQHQLNEERELKEKYIYDRSQGHYWHLRRPLTDDEWLLIEDDRAHGMSLGEILDKLNVLA